MAIQKSRTTTCLIHRHSQQNPAITLVFVCILIAKDGNAQPMDQPAEAFRCGNSSLMCNRWGYHACLKPDDEYFCLPCKEPYLRTKCGTREEEKGCNLYCTELAINKVKAPLESEMSRLRNDFQKQKAKMEVEHADEIKAIKKDLTQAKADLQESKKNHSHIENKAQTLEEKPNHYILYFYISLIVNCALGILGLLWILRFCKRRNNRKSSKKYRQRHGTNKRSASSVSFGTDSAIESNAEPSDELTDDQSDNTKLLKAGVDNVDETGCKEKDTHSCSTNVADDNVHVDITEADDGRKLPGRLKAINPTNGPVTGDHKLAINGKDHNIQQQTQL